MKFVFDIFSLGPDQKRFLFVRKRGLCIIWLRTKLSVYVVDGAWLRHDLLSTEITWMYVCTVGMYRYVDVLVALTLSVLCQRTNVTNEQKMLEQARSKGGYTGYKKRVKVYGNRLYC
jgi:hypothetical protein